MAHLNIIARTNGVGLDRDVDLINAAATSAGHQVTVSHCRSLPFYANWLPRKKRYDANIFLERIFPRWLSSAPLNILIPNQERFPERHLPRLAKIDHIFCKSQHAHEIFSKHHPSPHFIGFTSQSLHHPEIPRHQQTFLHLAGRSTLKGTETILNLWQKHPEWPPLTLLQHQENAPHSVPANVTLITDYLSDQELTTLANQHPIHLCPSLSEGWGHYIVEAMSCGALVITTDAPPMNELVTTARGLLVETSHHEPRHLGTNFHVSPTALERTINHALNLSETHRRQLGDAARSWTQANHRTFQDRLAQALTSAL